MKQLLLFAAIWAGIFAFGQAQNIVPNPGFETNSGCPTGPCQWNRATGWNNINGGAGCGSYGTPDYFHTCGGGFSHLPNNGFLTLNPHGGNAVMGFLTWSGSLSPNWREYVSRQLASPMIIGQNYTVSFWICNAYNPYYGGGSNHIGLDFHTTPHTQSIASVVSLVPEYEIPGVFFSNAWVNYTFNITPTAAWQYITFGNFYNDAATTAQVFDASAAYFRAYYFIDDISIVPSVVFPLELSAPTVSAAHTGSHVTWDATAGEGIASYAVERTSGPNEPYWEVGSVPANVMDGESQQYSLPDRELQQPGFWYYRIKATDIEGNVSYSETTPFEYLPQHPALIQILPNPAKNGQSSTLSLWLPAPGSPAIQLVDLKGRILKEIKHDLLAGENQVELPTAGLAAGIYFVKVAGAKSLRLLIQ